MNAQQHGEMANFNRLFYLISSHTGSRRSDSQPLHLRSVSTLAMVPGARLVR